MRQRKAASVVVVLVVLVRLASPGTVWAAPPTADQVLTDAGWSADAKQRVLAGEFVTKDAESVLDSDLAVGIAFLVKASPADLAGQIMAGNLVQTDAQVRASGDLSGPGSLSDLAGLTISSGTAQAFAGAQPGQALNLSTAEIAAFDALQGAGTEAVQAQLQKALLARYQAYSTQGLAGIAPYDRGGSSSDVAAELRKASLSAKELAKYMPAFQKVLVDYPAATVPGLEQRFRWVSYDISGTPTFVLTQTLAAADGDANVVVQRQFYVSTGYNAEQAVAGFLPVQEGTVVVYSNHTFTDQVAGFGGSLKRDVGRRMMVSKLKAMFETARKKVAR